MPLSTTKISSMDPPVCSYYVHALRALLIMIRVADLIEDELNDIRAHPDVEAIKEDGIMSTAETVI
jgi:hypothetical protein